MNNVRAVDVDDETQWVPLEQIYPGLSASETIKDLKPHEKESYLKRCRDWFRKSIQQILSRVDFGNHSFTAFKDVKPKENHKQYKLPLGSKEKGEF